MGDLRRHPRRRAARGESLSRGALPVRRLALPQLPGLRDGHGGLPHRPDPDEPGHAESPEPRPLRPRGHGSRPGTMGSAAGCAPSACSRTWPTGSRASSCPCDAAGSRASTSCSPSSWPVPSSRAAWAGTSCPSAPPSVPRERSSATFPSTPPTVSGPWRIFSSPPRRTPWASPASSGTSSPGSPSWRPCSSCRDASSAPPSAPWEASWASSTPGPSCGSSTTPPPAWTAGPAAPSVPCRSTWPIPTS